MSGIVTAEIKSARTLDEIFLVLSKNGFWNYLNYYPLQSVIEQFASDDNELRGMMEQYQKDLSGHTLALEIQRCLYMDVTNHVQINPAFPPPANVTDHSRTYLKDLWQSLENQLALPKLELILHNTAESACTSRGLSYQPVAPEQKYDRGSWRLSARSVRVQRSKIGGAKAPLAPPVPPPLLPTMLSQQPSPLSWLL